MGSPNNTQALLQRITRDQGPEFEQTLNFAALTQQSTPTSLRTDRKVKEYALHFRGRLTVGGAPVAFRAGPPLLGTPVFSLIQQVVLRGQHLRYGSQQPIIMRGETIAEYRSLLSPNYVPYWTVDIGAGPVFQGPLSGLLGAVNDIEFVLPIPTYPLDISPADVPFYCLHGPDWPGNLYMDVLCGDSTSLGVAVAAVAGFSAYGVAGGNPTIDILSERPLLTKDLMAKVRPAICFRNTKFQQSTNAVVAAGGAGVKLEDLDVGKDTTRILLKTGTILAGLSPGLVVFGALLNGICTRTFIALDNRQLRFGNANSDAVMQDYHARMYGNQGVGNDGYRLLDFISGLGNGAANPKAAFPSSQLTAARKFELDADTVAAATQIAEVVQEELLGQAALLG